MRSKRLGAIATSVAALVLIAGPAADTAAARHAGDSSSPAAYHDTSPPLRTIPPAPSPPPGTKKEKRQHGVPKLLGSAFDPVVQSSTGAAQTPSLISSFEGIGQGFQSYFVTSAPPDPNGSVGPNNYVEIVNQDFAVLDKSGNVVYGPVPTNTLFTGYGGGCETNDDGDGTVKYDQLANRWIIQQLSVSTTPYLLCVAVSTSGDPTGSYNRYSFNYGSDFPDYPKLGVWPDAYYMTFNDFANGGRFVGPEVCAYDRAKMLAGQAATQQCKQPGSNYASMLPSDLDGSTLPPSGSPNFLVALDSASLDVWKFHVDWTTPSNSTLSAASNIAVAGFSEACNGGVCIPQTGTNQQLDSLGDRLMYRLAYRNLGDHEALVVAHSVAVNGATGVRWYELRNPTGTSLANGTPVVFQQGTYAPDSVYRWMPSVAMDRNGDIALGYSVSSAATHPGSRYTVRTPADPANTMEAENTIVTGAGSQTGGLNRWGDYTSMAIDPSDDCTFYYTNQYLQTTGNFNWSTRVGTFKLPGCSASTTPDYSLSATPGSQTVTQGQSTSPYTVTVNPVNGFSGSVTLSAGGLPSGASASFGTNPTTSSSSMTLSTAPSTPPGTYTVTITGTSGSLTHTTSVSLVVNAAPHDFSLGAAPNALTVRRGSSGQYIATISNTDGTTYTGPPVSLTVSGLPSRTTGSFSPNPTSSTSTLTISVSRKASTVTNRTLTIAGSENGFTHTTTVTLTIS